MIFSFILVLFSFITDFYFCRNFMVPFKIFFAKTFLILQHCTFESSMPDPKPVSSHTARRKKVSKLLHCSKVCMIICQPKQVCFLFLCFLFIFFFLFSLKKERKNQCSVAIFVAVSNPFLRFPRPGNTHIVALWILKHTLLYGSVH